MSDRAIGNRPRQHPSKSLSALVAGSPDVAISGLAITTDDVAAGDLFLAAPGSHSHGAKYAAAAIERGAVAVLTDAEGAALVPEGVPVAVIDGVRDAAGPLAAAFYDHPAEALTTVGVTGTQGKTTTTHLIAAALGMPRCGIVGSIGSRIADVPVMSTLTTPEAPALQALFATMREERQLAAAVEVSSHSLELGRVDGFAFDVGVFLNLGHDHRDFHGDMFGYFAAKRKLLTPAHAKLGIVNIDDPWGRRAREGATIPLLTASIEGADADWRAVDLDVRPNGSSFTVVSPRGDRVPFTLSVRGRFNVGNTLTAVAALAESGYELESLVEGLAGYGGPEGRMQFVDFGTDYDIVIDSAHKPEALNAVLKALRPVVRRRIISVIGANGNRDVGKRRIMGRMTAMVSDVVIVTDDNPYYEDPASIREAVMDGARSSHERVYDGGDRAAAIRMAIDMAEPGDCVAILGKGDERYHSMPDGTVYWNDIDVAEEAVRERHG